MTRATEVRDAVLAGIAANPNKHHIVVEGVVAEVDESGTLRLSTARDRQSPTFDELRDAMPGLETFGEADEWAARARGLGAKVRSTRKAVAMAQKVATLPGVLRRLCAEQDAALEALIDHRVHRACASRVHVRLRGRSVVGQPELVASLRLRLDPQRVEALSHPRTPSQTRVARDPS